MRESLYNVLKSKPPGVVTYTGTPVLEPSFRVSDVASMCFAPVRGDLHYLENGRKIDRRLGTINRAYDYFKLLKQQGKSPTLFIHGVDRNLELWKSIAHEMGPEHFWRFSNVSVSVSEHKSTIGFHADMFEVIVLQITGSRQWNLWKPDNVDPDYLLCFRKGIMGDCPAFLSSCDDMLNLQSGECFMIPEYWGHDGVTSSIQTSVSLSFSWILCTPYILLTEFMCDMEDELRLQLERDDRMYEPIFAQSEVKNVLQALDTSHTLGGVEPLMNAATSAMRKLTGRLIQFS